MNEQNKRLLDPIIDQSDEIRPSKNNMNDSCYGSFMDCLGNFLGCLCLVTSCGCGCCFNPYKSINPGYRGVVTRFGTVKKVLDNGLHYINPLSEKLTQVDMMLHVKKLAKQSILTKDKLPVSIDGCVYYKINNNPKDIITSKFGVYNMALAVDELAHSTLRFVFGQHTLRECLEKRKEFAKEMRMILGDQAKSWGINIEDIQIIDIEIPKHIQDLLASAAVAEQEAQAQVIMAKASVQSANLMREAADLLNSPSAMQMRLLDTYKVLAESENSKLIFLPMDHNQLSNVTSTVMGNEITNNK